MPTRTMPAAAHSRSDATRKPARACVADAEPCDGHVVVQLVGGQHAEGDVLGAVPFELSGGAHAQAVAVQQHAEQELWVVGGVPMPVIAVCSVERGKVELVDHVEDEPGEVALGQPVAQVRREQEGLVAIVAQEVVGHGLLYLLTAFITNKPILNML
jgi:hypothetical protein